MAYDHSNCTHPRTPAGRAVCRKQRAGGDETVAKPRTPATPTTRTATTPKTSTVALKRPGTKIKGRPDMADVPRAFSVAIAHAHELGWVVRIGETYNDAERRIEVFGTHGVITLVWSASNPDGLHSFSFRPNASSVSTRTVSVSAAFVLAQDGIEAA